MIETAKVVIAEANKPPLRLKDDAENKDLKKVAKPAASGTTVAAASAAGSGTTVVSAAPAASDKAKVQSPLPEPLACRPPENQKPRRSILTLRCRWKTPNRRASGSRMETRRASPPAKR